MYTPKLNYHLLRKSPAIAHWSDYFDRFTVDALSPSYNAYNEDNSCLTHWVHWLSEILSYVWTIIFLQEMAVKVTTESVWIQFIK